jgi:hypothetical protein
MNCDSCTTRKDTPKLPRGWKRLGEQTYCSACWTAKFMLRAITFPVIGPVDPADWPKLREVLKQSWSDSTRLGNWALTELAKAESPRDPQAKRMPKLPHLYLYPAARKLVPQMTPISVVSLLNSVQRKYYASRIDVLWRGTTSLPIMRYPIPYPIHNQAWEASYLTDTEKVPLLTVRLAGQRFTLRLKGGPQMYRQLTAFDALITGRALAGEAALYRVRINRADPGAGVEDRGLFTRVMAKLVMWLPKQAQGAAAGELRLARGKDCLWCAEISRHDPWRLNADYARTWIIGHQNFLHRISEDEKAERRAPKVARKHLNELRARRVLKHQHRMDTFCHTAAKMLAEYAVRQKIARVIYDPAPTDYMPSFPWFKLEQMLQYKLDERHIALETTDGTRTT